MGASSYDMYDPRELARRALDDEMERTGLYSQGVYDIILTARVCPRTNTRRCLAHLLPLLDRRKNWRGMELYGVLWSSEGLGRPCPTRPCGGMLSYVFVPETLMHMLH